MGNYQRWQNWAFGIFSVLLLSGLIIYNVWGEEVPINELKFYINDLGIWAPIVFVVLYAFATIFIPSTPFMALSGVLFGFKYGLLYTVIGGFISAMFVFILSRLLGAAFSEKILRNERLKKIGDYNESFREHGLWSLIILRIMPVMPFNVLNLLMGISKIKTRDYILGTLIGLAPSNVITVYFGSFIFTAAAQKLSFFITTVVIAIVLMIAYRNIRKNFRKN